ncbi:hypothetical protein B0J14DRAFT_129651 [Halenospora varia]|nr:hypothetical protein B0J14DRAFT_129651 [Halenospora varia]
MAMPNSQEENPSSGGFSKFAMPGATTMSQPQTSSDTVFGSTMSSQLQGSAKLPFGFSSSMASFSNGPNLSSSSPFQITSPFATTANPSSGASTPLFAKLAPVLPGIGQSGMLAPAFDFNTFRSAEEILEDQENERVLAIDKAAAEQDDAEVTSLNNKMSKKAAARARAANSGLDILAGVLDTLDLVKTPEEMNRERKRIIEKDMKEKKELRMKMRAERNAAKKAAQAGLNAEEAAEMAFSLLSLDPEEKHPILTRKEKHLQRLEHLRQKAIEREQKRTLWRTLVEEIEEFPAELPLPHIRDMRGLDLIRALLLSHKPDPTEDDGYRESMICFKRAFQEETVDGHKFTLQDVLEALLPSIKEKYVCFVACRVADPRDMTEDQKYMYATTTSRIGIVRRRDRRRADAASKQTNATPTKDTTEKTNELNDDPDPRPARKAKKGKRDKKSAKGEKGGKPKDTKAKVKSPSTRTERRVKLKKARQDTNKGNISGRDARAGVEMDTSMDVDAIGKMVAE